MARAVFPSAVAAEAAAVITCATVACSARAWLVEATPSSALSALATSSPLTCPAAIAFQPRALRVRFVPSRLPSVALSSGDWTVLTLASLGPANSVAPAADAAMSSETEVVAVCPRPSAAV